jgi:salicylate hydroxylase
VLLGHVDTASLHLGKSFASVTSHGGGGNGLLIAFEDGSSAEADIVLGSDGIHSPVRRAFVPSSKTQWTGGLFYRSCFPRSHVEHIANLPDEAVHYWGPDHSFFVTPLAGGLYSVVASRQCDTNAPPDDSIATWDSLGDVNTLKEQYKDWSPLVREIIDATPFTRVYRNTAAEELDTWLLGDGRITLAGDAAHAHGGAYAAGGSLAINDAWAFAQSVLHVFPANTTVDRATTHQDTTRALKLYEKTRKAHTDRLQRLIQDRNRALAEAIGKRVTDEQIRQRMKNRSDLAWLHEHDVEAAFTRAVASV